MTTEANKDFIYLLNVELEFGPNKNLLYPTHIVGKDRVPVPIICGKALFDSNQIAEEEDPRDYIGLYCLASNYDKLAQDIGVVIFCEPRLEAIVATPEGQAMYKTAVDGILQDPLFNTQCHTLFYQVYEGDV